MFEGPHCGYFPGRPNQVQVWKNANPQLAELALISTLRELLRKRNGISSPLQGWIDLLTLNGVARIGIYLPQVG